ncbi:DUF1993 domain-containing protein [Ideonella sp. DXS22W]|uniref:DUF1993 domain-containing protein n=1 Tax=Pseudaquabacterium inlustre TaxID=2984192 RepID=A0ABU9CJN7_9BURK
MPSISMHSASVPLFQKQLGAMLAWLDKAEAHAQARGFSPDNYLQLRLAPDMLPFVSQIRIAGDTAKGCVARLAGEEPPKFDDDETTFAQLRGRIQKTLDYIGSVPAAAIDGSESREIVLPMRHRDPLRFTGEVYLRHWALPNFYFHVTTAYALLRHAGVALGKGDYLAMG